jgi:TonB family protein
MSAAINDRTHDATLSRLPLTGEFHPLRREFERLLATGNAVALIFAMLACTLVYVWPRDAMPTDSDGLFTTGGIFTSPPPIAPHRGGPKMPAIAPNLDNGLIEPVEDEDLVQESDIPEPGGGDGELDDLSSDGSLGPIHEGEIAPPIPPAPPVSPEFNWFDEAPVLLFWTPPVYPAMVREAGIDGTVHIRVLVDLSGKVKDALVVDGPAVLRDAALTSARTARFKPALQGVHPVEVWVVMPITFELRGNH